MKIVVGGALNKKENAELIETYGNGQVEVQIMQIYRLRLHLKTDRQTTISAPARQEPEERWEWLLQ